MACAQCANVLTFYVSSTMLIGEIIIDTCTMVKLLPVREKASTGIYIEYSLFYLSYDWQPLLRGSLSTFSSRFVFLVSPIFRSKHDMVLSISVSMMSRLMLNLHREASAISEPSTNDAIPMESVKGPCRVQPRRNKSRESILMATSMNIASPWPEEFVLAQIEEHELSNLDPCHPCIWQFGSVGRCKIWV